jgi:hypothetical protein
MKLSSFKRLITKDFPEESRTLIEQLGSTLNDSFNQVYSALNKRLTFIDNIACTVKDVQVIVDSSGNPTQVAGFNLDIPNMTVLGVIVIKVDNLTNSILYPTAAPFISFQIVNNTVRINNITGLIAGNVYRIKVIAIN